MSSHKILVCEIGENNFVSPGSTSS